jgi:hypothetical protein
MSLTKAQIRDRVAQEIGILQIGQSLENTDQVRIEQGYDEVYADLKRDNLNFWSATGEVPNQFVPYVVALVAMNVSGTYSIPNERYARISPMADMARARIASLGSQPYKSTKEPVDY